MVARKKKIPLPIVSLGKDVVFEESLPFSWVNYPNHYGTFFVFSSSKNGPWIFCKCNETPLTNLFELNKKYPLNNNINPLRLASIDNLHVPDEIAEIARLNPENPIDAFQFKKQLCHRCNITQPTLRYCHEMYGGNFDQSYGWYVNQSYLRYGVDPWSKTLFLPEICPDNIQNIIKGYTEAQKKMIEEDTYPTDSEEYIELRKNFNKLSRNLKNTFINFTREEFGFRKVGEGWVSETIVFKIIKEILPETEIIRNHRPDWLEGLEIDIYLPKLRLGVEYQGQQHFKPIKAWGGKKALKGVQERDRKKVKICSKKGIMLLHINYTDPLTKSFISNELVSGGINIST